MLTITTTATEKIKEILLAEGKEDWGLRVFTSGGGCCGPSFGLDIIEKGEEGDEVLEQDGLKVYIDAQTMASLSDKTFDYVQNGGQEGFAITGGASACGTGDDGASSCGSGGGCSSC